MRRRDFIKTPLAAPFLSAAFGASGPQEPPQAEACQIRGTLRVFEGGTLRFELRDLLDHPFYSWPRTLVTYPVQFDHVKVKASQLSLMRLDTAEKVPFQLSEVRNEGGYLQFAKVSIFSDLPAGGTRQFELSDKPATATRTANETPVKESRDGDTIVLDAGPVKVRIPVSQTIHGKAPGPVLQVSRGGGWFGDSRIVSPQRRVLSVTSTREESGPLFISYRMTYQLEGGPQYIARVRCVSGYDFVEFFEEMKGLGKAEGAFLETSWTGFHPTHRQAPNHPYYPRVPAGEGYQRYTFEKIDEPFVNNQHGVFPGMSDEGELPFRLGIYQPWGAYVQLTSANFWDERTNDALGIFVNHVSRWQDHDYALWNASTTLQVRYYYRDGILRWKWPLVTGTRSTGIVAYDHRKDIESVERTDQLARRKRYRDGMDYQTRANPVSYVLSLQNLYSTVDLNEVKDWVLEYPEDKKRQPVIFKLGLVNNPDELAQRIMTSELVADLPIYGTRQNMGFNPVASRQIDDWWIDGFSRLYSQLSERQKKRLTALFLMFGHVYTGEDFMPMVTMLSGHPNFLSDIRTVPARVAFLFPDHPKAIEWADEYEKFCELNSRYHTRPEVKDWEAKGGRWTENLGTYVWATLRPATHANWLLREHFDGKNRLVTPQFAQVGDWIVNALSAPFDGEDPKYSLSPNGTLERHYWGMVTAANGPRRVHPPQGAHSARRMPPRTAWLLGAMLARYQPLTAEHLMWAAKPTDDDMEVFKDPPNSWWIMYNQPDNRGTNPHLKTSKYTGYGMVLRAAVDTPEEFSVHLQQIDQGPNYRWGVAGEGGCGVIYYFANGKCYSCNGREDVGDRAAQDTDFCSNFGVFKEGRFKSIGMNVLDQPLYDLDLAKHSELRPRQGKQAYSWPEYVSRSVTLVGNDYFVIYDEVWNDSVAHRFSWFTHVGEDLPYICLVKGGEREREVLKTELQTGITKGVWRDGMGDSMAVVSHKTGLDVQNTAYGCRVTLNGATDDVFRDPRGIRFSDDDKSFTGTAGVIRTRPDGSHELAIFHGSSLAAGGVSLTVDDPNLGVSARFKDPAELRGVAFARKDGTLEIELEKGVAAASAFYVDGAPVSMARDGRKIKVKLPAGRHTCQLTSQLPVPNAPRMLRTENQSAGAKVFFSAVAGATNYRVELSRDGGATWHAAGATGESSFTLSGLENGTKVHVRVVAANALHESEPADEYPVYVSNQPLLPPDGLKLRLGAKKVDLNWGEVLGVSEYRVYRRVKGTSEFSLIHHGLAREFRDENVDVIPAYAELGEVLNVSGGSKPKYAVYEYAIAAANGNGEGARCTPVNTDPGSWTNWDPKPGEGFRRNLAYSVASFLPGTEPLPDYPSGRKD